MIYLKLFLSFFKIGLFTFGGGYAMIPLIKAEVASNGWLSLEKLVDFIAVSESTPGPFAVNMATYIGTVKGGFLGAACATLGVVTPSFIIILIVARCYAAFKENKIVKGVMSGLRPAVVGLIGAAFISVGASVFFVEGFSFDTCLSFAFILSLAIFALAVFLSFKKTSPILIIMLCAVLGIAAGYAEEALLL